MTTTASPEVSALPARCVLVAVDERDESVETARAALRLMGPDARYVLVNVGSTVLPWAADPMMWGMVPPAMVMLTPDANESVRMAGDANPTAVDRAEATADQVASSAGLPGAATVGVTARDTGGAICSVAHEQGADVIVIGHRHRNWLDRMFSRSTTTEVLRNAECPVLVVN